MSEVFRRLLYDFANERQIAIGEWTGAFVLAMSSEDPEWDKDIRYVYDRITYDEVMYSSPFDARNRWLHRYDIVRSLAGTLLGSEIQRRKVRGEPAPFPGELLVRYL